MYAVKTTRQRDRPAESTKFKITVAVFPEISKMSQHGYMRHTATPPLVLDLIRLIQSAGTAVECLILHYS